MSLTGGALGLLLAAWGMRAMLKLLPEALPRMDDIGRGRASAWVHAGRVGARGNSFRPDAGAENFTDGPAGSLKEGGRSVIERRIARRACWWWRRSRWRWCCWWGAGLMIRSVAHLWRVNPGFDPHNAVEFSLSLAPDKISDAAKIRAAYRQLLNGLGTTPGVEAASLMAGSMPLKGSDSDFPFWLEGQPKPPTESEMSLALWYGTSPDYLKAMGIPLLRGRYLTAQDSETAPQVMVIDEDLRRVFRWAGPDREAREYRHARMFRRKS